MPFRSTSLVCLLTLTLSVLAQSTAWGQCGGENWAGATTCVSGYTCTYSNPYYSQCLPGASTVTTTSISKSSSSVSKSSSSASTTSTSPAAPSQAVNYWFSFGDSYTQTQFVDTGTLPSVGNPMGNPAYPGYTAVGGVNWIDVNTVVYNRSLILTYNYAYGGATIDANLVAPYESSVLSVTDQVTDFLANAGTKPAASPWTSANSLFSIWIGINDIGNSYSDSGNRSAFDSVLLDAEFALVQKLYNVGARNFLWINVPAIDRSPLMVPEGTAATSLEKSVIADFNSQLVTYIAQFKANNTGVVTYLFDSNTLFNTVLDDPTAYGFVDNSSYGNTGDFWGNNYHPSAAMQTIIGQNVSSVLAGTVW